MKFLAVLAVLAMAFAAFAVVAPAETDDAADATIGEETDYTLDGTAKKARPVTGASNNEDYTAGPTDEYKYFVDDGFALTKGADAKTLTFTGADAAYIVYIGPSEVVKFATGGETVTIVSVLVDGTALTTVMSITLKSIAAQNLEVTTDVNGMITLNGAAATGTATITGTVEVPADAVLTIGANEILTLESGATFTNNGSITASSDLNVVGTLINNGIISDEVTNDLIVDAAGKVYNNAAGIISYDQLVINGYLYNYGLLKAKAAGSPATGSGTLYMDTVQNFLHSTIKPTVTSMYIGNLAISSSDFGAITGATGDDESTAAVVTELGKKKIVYYSVSGEPKRLNSLTIPEGKILVIPTAGLNADQTISLEDGAALIYDNATAANGDFTVVNASATSTNKISFDGVVGDLQITTGSLKIAGIIEGDILGITGDVYVDMLYGAASMTISGIGAAGSSVTFVNHAVFSGGTGLMISNITLKSGEDLTLTNDTSLTLQNVAIDGGEVVSILTGKTATLALNNVTGDLTFDGEGTFSLGANSDIYGKLTICKDLTSFTQNSKTLTVGTELIVNGVFTATAATKIVAPKVTVSEDGSIINAAKIFANGTTDKFVNMAVAEGNDIVLEGLALSGTISKPVGAVTDLPAVTATTTYFENVKISDLEFDGMTSANPITIGLKKAEITGNITIPENVFVVVDDADATGLTIDKGVIVRLGGVIGSDNGGQTAKVLNNGTISFISKDASLTYAYTLNTYYVAILGDSTGSVIATAIATEGVIGGTYSSVATPFSKEQIITAAENVVFAEGAFFTFYGEFIIPEGVTVTIEAGANVMVVSATGKLVNNGTLIVEAIGLEANNGTANGGLYINGATLENNGTILLDHTAVAPDTAEPTIKFAGRETNNGTINVGEQSVMTVSAAGFVNKGTIDIDGYIVAGQIENQKDINVNGKIDSNVSINQTTKAAKVTIESLEFVEAGGDTFTVTAVTEKITGKTSKLAGNSAITITNTTAAGIFTDLVITNAAYTQKDADGNDVKYYAEAIIAGSPDYESTNATAYATITGFGRTVIKGELALSENVKFTSTAVNTTHADFGVFISGYVFVEDPIAAIADTQMTVTNVTVTGSVVSEKDVVTVFGTATKNYAAYKTKDAGNNDLFYYTTLQNALEFGEANVTVYGKVTVDKDVVIPAGITVTQAAGSLITIDESATLYVTSGAKLFVASPAGGVKVDGALYFENVRTGQKGDATGIAYEVKTVGTEDVLYTSLTNALKTSEAGDVIELNGNAVIKKDVTIPVLVTVKTKANTLTVDNDAKLTVAGALDISEGGSYVLADEVPATSSAPKKEAGKIALDGIGYIVNDSKMTYSSDSDWPTGAYYSITVGADTLYYIQKLDAAAVGITAYDGKKIDVYGSASLSALAIAGDKDNKVTVNFKDKVSGTASVSYATLNFVEGKAISATFTNGSQSIAITDAKVGEGFKIANAKAGDVENILTAYGALVEDLAEGKEYKLVIDGANVSAVSFPSAILNGNVTDLKSSTYENLTVNGTYTVVNGQTTTVEEDLKVFGTAVAAAKTDDKSAGKIAVGGSIFLGIDMKDLSAAASLTGDVTFGAEETYAYAFVAAGSTVPAGFADLKSTEIYVEKKLVMTVYANSALILPDIEYLFDLGIENAVFKNWTDADGDLVLSPYVGTNGKLYAVVDKAIYTVSIITDAGVKSVAIDGIQLVNGGFVGNNVYTTLNNLEAGTHTVSYTLMSGYEGIAQLYTQDGTILKDLKFVVSGVPEDGETVVSEVFQLYGTEQIIAPEPSPVEQNEWTITTILLVILVILIAIMAVIVALRLNRS